MKTSKLIHLCSGKNIPTECIMMLEADSNYTKVYFKDDSSFLLSITIETLEKRLQGAAFFRSNRSVIINTEFIVSVERNRKSSHFGRVLLLNKKAIDFSRRKSEVFFCQIFKNHW